MFDSFATATTPAHQLKKPFIYRGVGKPESRENLSIDGERKSIGLVGSERDGRQICLIKMDIVPGSRPKMRFTLVFHLMWITEKISISRKESAIE